MPFAGGVLPPAPRLLYLLSPCLTQELPYWPASVQVTHTCSSSHAFQCCLLAHRPRMPCMSSIGQRASPLQKSLLFCMQPIDCFFQLQLCGHALEQVVEQPSAQPEARLAHEGAPLGGTAAAPAYSPPQAPSAKLAETDTGAATWHFCISHTAQAVCNSASSAAHPVCECRKRQALGKAVPGGKREECEGPRSKAQRLDWPVLIDFGSVGCMGLLGSASAFLKLLQTALELAGLKAVLLTGVARHAIIQRQCRASLTLGIQAPYSQDNPDNRSRQAVRGKGAAIN